MNCTIIRHQPFCLLQVNWGSMERKCGVSAEQALRMASMTPRSWQPPSPCIPNPWENTCQGIHLCSGAHLTPFMSSPVGMTWQMSCRAGMAISSGPHESAPSASQASRPELPAQRPAQERGLPSAASAICARLPRSSHRRVHGTVLLAKPSAAVCASCNNASKSES